MILQSLPCHHVTFTAFLFIITPTGCRRPPVLTSTLVLSWNTPLVCYCAAALHASSFDLLCYGFYIEQYRKNIDVFFGIEHGMKGEEAERQFNKLAKSSLKIAVDTRDTEGSTGQADKKHASGSVCIAIDRWSLVAGGQQRERTSENGSRQRRKNCTSMAQC